MAAVVGEESNRSRSAVLIIGQQQQRATWAEHEIKPIYKISPANVVNRHTAPTHSLVKGHIIHMWQSLDKDQFFAFV